MDSKLSNSAFHILDSRLSEFKVPLWLTNRQNFIGVDSESVTVDTGLKTNLEMGLTSVPGQGATEATDSQLDFRTCRKLCEDGPVSDAVEALDLLGKRGCHVPNNLFYLVLKKCMQGKDLSLGRRIHALSVKSGYEGDAFLATHLICLYASQGKLEEAVRVFTKVSTPDAYNWAAIISAYARNGEPAGAAEAIRLYRRMSELTTVKPDDRLFSAVLKACAAAHDLVAGKEVHTHILATSTEPSRFVQAGLVNMYAKCGSLQDARRLFDRILNRDVVIWNAMIAGYAQQGEGQEAVSLYRSMQQEGLTRPNSVTYVSLFQAYASLGVGALEEGKQLHAQVKELGLDKDSVLCGSLVNMYVKCGRLEEARIVFDKLSRRDVVQWTAMIGGYAQQGMSEEAISLYRTMQQEGLAPNYVTYVSLLQACAAVAALPVGEQLHAEIVDKGMQADGMVGAALVNMYAKCGSMHDSQRVFDSLIERTLGAWGALVGGYARQGDCQTVFNLVDRMNLEGVHQNDITFLSVLTVCSHVGLVDKGKHYFESMRTDYGISATLEHYICMIGLLGRAGHLDEALQMAKTMPFPPDDAVWRTLLGACRKWKNVSVGQQAFEGALSANGKDPTSYVVMSSIYASRQMWKAAKEMQAKRRKLEAWKTPGQSWWTDMRGVVHTFVVGDKKHPESGGIYARLEQLIPEMKKEGYVPHLESSLMDIPDDEKQQELCEHSEKLAIAYALSKTGKGTTIRIANNAWLCEDCHTATAYISKIEKRTIICRDVSRFHVFKDGKCSCGNYW